MDHSHLRSLRVLGAVIFLSLCLLFAPSKAQAADNSEMIFTYLTSELDYSPAAACGILANMYYESNFTPGITNYLGAYGLCQWLGQRRTRLNSFCSARGYSVSSIRGQLEYLAYELKTYYKSVNNYLKNVKNTAAGAYNAAAYFCRHFEIPENVSYNAALRGTRAKNVYWPKFGSSSIWAYGWNGSKGIYMRWTGSGATTYQIWRSTKSSSGFRRIGTISGSYHSCGDPKVKVGTTYYYYIVATNKSGKEQARSNTISVTRESNLTDSVCSIRLKKTNWTYTGKRLTPVIIVTYDGKTLTRNTDYTVSYGKNTEAGDGTITVKGKGDYGGSVTLTFTIAKATTVITVENLTTYLVRGSVTPAVSVSGAENISYRLFSANTAVATVNGKRLKLTGPGRSLIKVTVAETANYTSAKKFFWLYVRPKKLTIKKATVSSGSVTVQWDAVKSVTGYEIQYTKNSSFTSSSPVVKVYGTGRKSGTFSPGKGTWRIRIRSFKKITDSVTVTSLWSSAVTVRVK